MRGGLTDAPHLKVASKYVSTGLADHGRGGEIFVNFEFSRSKIFQKKSL